MTVIGFLEAASVSIARGCTDPRYLGPRSQVNTGGLGGPGQRTRNNRPLRHHHCDDDCGDKRGTE